MCVIFYTDWIWTCFTQVNFVSFSAFQSFASITRNCSQQDCLAILFKGILDRWPNQRSCMGSLNSKRWFDIQGFANFAAAHFVAKCHTVNAGEGAWLEHCPLSFKRGKRGAEVPFGNSITGNLRRSCTAVGPRTLCLVISWATCIIRLKTPVIVF